MQIRQVDRYVYDIFNGTGFDNWTRIQKFPWGIRVLKGNRLSKEESVSVTTAIERMPHGGIASV